MLIISLKTRARVSSSRIMCFHCFEGCTILSRQRANMVLLAPIPMHMRCNERRVGSPFAPLVLLLTVALGAADVADFGGCYASSSNSVRQQQWRTGGGSSSVGQQQWGIGGGSSSLSQQQRRTGGGSSS